jgi:YYY domain-containing protein
VTEAATWLLIIEVLGAMAFPFVFLLLRFLPDRGYSFAKIVGLLIVSYLLWLGASLHLFPNARWSIILLFALSAAVSSALAWRRRRELVEFLVQRRSYIAFVEALFVGAFIVALFLRSYVAEFQEASGEKPMNNAFINAVLRADYFPPEDPWLSGHNINYYYFGHVTVATVTKLSGVPSYISFNLALALLSALSVVAAFGIGYNLVAERARFRSALLVGVLGSFLLMILSNIEGLFELLAVHGIGSKGFYKLVDIKGLDGPRDSSAWYPTEFLWALRAINFVTGQVDRQFPYYKFMQGEVHSETLAIPFVLLVVALALNLWRSPANGNGLSWWRKPWLFAFTALALGTVIVVQTWYAPTFFLVLAVTFAIKSYLSERRINRAFLISASTFALLLPLTAVLFYLPFFRTNFGSFGGINVEGELASRPHHLLYMWLPLFWLAGSLAVATLRGLKLSRSVFVAGLSLPLLVIVLWAALVALGQGTTDFPAAIKSRVSDGNFLSLLILVGLLAATSVALLHQLRMTTDGAQPRASAFALSLSAVALLLILGVEFFSVDDKTLPRFDTLIKANYMAWFLLSIVGAFAVYYILTNLKSLAWKAGWGAITLIILMVGSIFPVLTTFSYTASFENEQHLNLLWKWERYAPGEYEAVRWLQDNVHGTPTIVEAVGDAYSSYARVSSYTGLPTVLGWPSHEFHWRGGSWEPQAGRREAVERIYETTDPAEAKALLDQYDVEYVYVGPLERQTYGEAGLSKFPTFMDVAYENADVSIYRVSEPAEARER